MLDIGWTEIVVVAVVALVVLGPKELPRALKTFGAVMSKARSMAREFQSGVDEMIREAELDDLRKDLQQATRLDFDESPSKDKRIDPTSGEASSGETAQPALPPGNAGAAAAGTETAAPATVDAQAAATTATEAPAPVAPASGTQAAGTVETAAPKPDVAAAQDAAGDVKQVPASSHFGATSQAAAAGEAPPFGANRFDRDYAGASEAQALGDFLPPEAEPEDAAPAGASDTVPDDTAGDTADAPTGSPARAAG